MATVPLMSDAEAERIPAVNAVFDDIRATRNSDLINNICQEKPLPVYGDGSNIRDWLWVGDHARAIDLVFHGGRTGETYNIGGHNERTNIELVENLFKRS